MTKGVLRLLGGICHEDAADDADESSDDLDSRCVFELAPSGRFGAGAEMDAAVIVASDVKVKICDNLVDVYADQAFFTSGERSPGSGIMRAALRQGEQKLYGREK